jgi:hypothetical protein
MVTCRSSQTIESPVDEGVGSNLVAVAVGGGDAVAVAGGPVVVRRCEQAEKMSRPRKRTAGIFFKRNMDNHPIPPLVSEVIKLLNTSVDQISKFESK